MEIVEMKNSYKGKILSKREEKVIRIGVWKWTGFLESDYFNKYKLRYILIRYNITWHNISLHV